ncbi:MAG: ABC transporter substrate-binding protein [Proteobacteria bacterium]|nr:ABC transporter substrate-binding protein [Pseudomonadota bacterium]
MRSVKFARSWMLTVIALGLAAAPAAAQKRGGDINVLLYAGFNSIDPHFTGTYPARNALLGIYESLVAVDENASTVPMLAESVDISPDGLTYRFPLRKGVKFHNGKEMTAADVKASLERYARLSPNRVFLEPVTAIETPDPYLVIVKLKVANPSFLDRLAAPTSPASVIPVEEAAKELNKTGSIGTGPLQFVEWVPDSHYRMKRFDDYVANKSLPERTGFAGPKTVYLDTVTLRVVAEASARIAALEAGQVQFVEDVPGPAAQRLAGNPKIRIVDLPTFQMPVLYLNHALAPTGDLSLRRAIQAALDMDEVMGAAAAGSPYVLQHAWTYKGHPLYSEAGKSLYDQHNLAKAKELVKTSGYKGEEILLNVGNIGFMTRLSVVVAQSLKEAGLNVRVSTMELGTLFDISGKDAGWHITTSGYGSQPFLGPYMYQSLMVGPANLSRRKGDTVMEGLWQEFDGAANPAAKKAAWEKIQQRTYDEVYYVKLGDLGLKYAMVSNLAGFKAYPGALRFWNTWLE